MSKPTFSPLTRARSFARSMLSRGLGYLGYARHAPAETQALRELGCNGDGGALGPCPHREPSQNHPGSFICGACGCGDRRAVLVSGDVPRYGKLSYPYLSCPAGMPGFSNYVPSAQDPEADPRKATIERRSDVARLEALARGQRRGFEINRWRRRLLGGEAKRVQQVFGRSA